MGGLAGGLLVLPSERDAAAIPSDVSSLYTDAKLAIIQHWYFGAENNNAKHTAFVQNSYTYIAQEKFTADPGAVNASYTLFAAVGEKQPLDNFLTVNGQYQPSTTVQVDRAQLFQFVGALAFPIIELQLSNLDDCTLQLVARDGIFNANEATGSYLTLSTGVFLQPGTRADVALLCSKAAEGTTVTIAAQPHVAHDRDLSTNNRYTQAVVMTVDVAPQSSGMRPLASSIVPAPCYLADLTNVASANVNDDSIAGVVLAVPESTTKSGKTVFGNPGWVEMKAGVQDENINGHSFAGFDAKEYVMELCLDQVYEVTLAGPGATNPTTDGGAGTSAHPYHQHVNHFQMATTDEESSGALWRKGEWRDVVPIPFWGSTIRFKPVHFPGDIIMHCHLLEHEDMGMMGLMKVSDCGANDKMNVCDGSTTVPTDQLDTTTAEATVSDITDTAITDAEETDAEVSTKSTAAIVGGAASALVLIAGAVLAQVVS
jgi:FtsP/CotA-like multicopper oxidase with cupredoxin domain